MSVRVPLPRPDGTVEQRELHEPRSLPTPAVLDSDATLGFRHHLWSYGFGVAEAMDTAQPGMGLDWKATRELIERSAAEAASVGGRIAAGAGPTTRVSSPTAAPWFHNIAAAAVIYRATGSSLMVALVSILQFLSITLLAPVAGTLTDRFDRRRLLLASQLLCLVASVALVVGGVAVVDLTTRAGVPLILVVTAVLGVGTAVGTPAMQALVPNLVRGEQMETAVALNSVTFNLARVIGPALGGIVFASAGALPAFAINGFSYLPLVIVLLVLDSPAQARPDRSERSSLTALRFVRADGVAAWLLLSLVALTLVGDPVFTLTPALAERFGQDVAAVGEQVAAFGLGSAVGLLALGPIRRRYAAHRVALGGLGVVAIGMAAVALSPVYLAALGSFLLAGTGFLIAGALLTASLHRRLPEELRGRVMALWGVAYLGTRPVGAAINGGMADLLGVVPAVAIAAALGVVALVLLAPRLWHEPPSG